MARGQNLATVLLDARSASSAQVGDKWVDAGGGFSKFTLGVACLLHTVGKLPARMYSVEHEPRYVEVAKAIHKELGNTCGYEWAKLVEDGGIHQVRPRGPQLSSARAQRMGSELPCV
jgi:predicted RNA methylase